MTARERLLGGALAAGGEQDARMFRHEELTRAV